MIKEFDETNKAKMDEIKELGLGGILSGSIASLGTTLSSAFSKINPFAGDKNKNQNLKKR